MTAGSSPARSPPTAARFRSTWPWTGLTPDGDGFRLHGRAEHLDRYAFGVTKGKGMVGRYLDLELDVVASPA